ncbi:hypothetical protein KV205_32475 [Streptomyces sp. SKN60]|uniref:hypothetical protein n=1 Tax=Streptomyces sp. SKN60 TaxID=2855506 RepID=UPI0022485B14|nr:hypothetical protein [Streptomyces sp. SKN60]MCX2185193.1 hypothetical protein [Streptomyces sp. SKN60]
MSEQRRIRRISLTVAATAVAAAAVFLTASGDGLAPGLSAAAATAEPTEGDVGSVSVGVDSGGTVGVTEGGTADGGTADGGTTDGGTTDGGTVGVSEGSTSGETTGGVTTGGVTTGGGDPTESPTPTPTDSGEPPTSGIPRTAAACWNPNGKPLTGTFVALVPAGTLPNGNKATLVELSFAPKTDPATGVLTDDRILTRFAPAGGAWTAADPVPLELDTNALKPFRPVVPGATLKMPEIRVTDVNCWDATVSALAGTLRFGGDGGNGGPEVKLPVTWQRS